MAKICNVTHIQSLEARKTRDKIQDRHRWKEKETGRDRRNDVQQHITLMDIYCGALGLGRIRVYHVTKNTDTYTHTPT